MINYGVITFRRTYIMNPFTKHIGFKNLKPSNLPDAKGYYLIEDNKGNILYVGRTLSIRRRVYTNHLQGNKSTAKLKKYIIEDNDAYPTINSLSDAKKYLKNNCKVYWYLIGDISDHDYKLNEHRLIVNFDPKYLN